MIQLQLFEKLCPKCNAVLKNDLYGEICEDCWAYVMWGVVGGKIHRKSPAIRRGRLPSEGPGPAYENCIRCLEGD